MCAGLAQILRQVALKSPEHVEALAPWIARLQNTSDADAQASMYQTRRPFQELIRLVMLSDQLRSAGNLKQAVVQACEAVLPGPWYEHVRTFLQKSQLGLPDAGQIPVLA
eukprot:1508324-Lingulodinium_polyedra.AAC.1